MDNTRYKHDRNVFFFVKESFDFKKVPRSGEQFEKFVAVKKSFPGSRAIARPEYFLVADAAAGARAGGEAGTEAGKGGVEVQGRRRGQGDMSGDDAGEPVYLTEGGGRCPVAWL